MSSSPVNPFVLKKNHKKVIRKYIIYSWFDNSKKTGVHNRIPRIVRRFKRLDTTRNCTNNLTTPPNMESLGLFMKNVDNNIATHLA